MRLGGVVEVHPLALFITDAIMVSLVLLGGHLRRGRMDRRDDKE